MVYPFLLVRGIHLLKGFSLDLGVLSAFFSTFIPLLVQLCFMFVLYFWGLNPTKEGPFYSKQGSFGFL